MLFCPRYRGRTAGYPIAPSQIPACGSPAQGSSALLASCSNYYSCPCYFLQWGWQALSAFLIRICFLCGLRAQYRHFLPLVIGPTLYKYYEMIWLPSLYLSIRQPSFDCTVSPLLARMWGGSQVPDAPLTTCHALGPRQSPRNLTNAIPLCRLPLR
jgi:hypothetical protein